MSLNIATRYSRTRAHYKCFLIDRKHWDFFTYAEGEMPMGMHIIDRKLAIDFIQLFEFFNSVLKLPYAFNVKRIQWRGVWTAPHVLSSHAVTVYSLDMYHEKHDPIKSYVNQIAANLDFEWTSIRFEFRRSSIFLQFEGGPSSQQDPLFFLEYPEGDTQS